MNFPIHSKSPGLGLYSPFARKAWLSKKPASVIFNTTWASNTMVSSKKNWRVISKKTYEQKDEQTLFIWPSGHDQDSYKTISQVSSIAVDNKNKMQYNSVSIPHYPRTLFKFKLGNYLHLSPACFTLEALQQF